MATSRKRDISIDVVVDDKQAKAQLKGIGDESGKLGTKFKQLGVMLAGAFAADKIVDFVQQSIQSFSQLQQSTGAVESVFGEFAKNIEKAAKSAGDAVGLSAGQYQELAANLGGMLQNLGMSVEESAAKAQELIVVGADLSATYGGTVADAVSSISSLLRGERDPIEKYAISIKDADVQARAMALGLDKSTSEAKKNSDAIAALDILYEQSAKSAGQFAREADTVAGSMQRAEAELENAKAQLGQGFHEAVVGATPAVGAFADSVGLIGIALQQATGQITANEAAIKLWENTYDRAVETAEDAVEIHQKEFVAYKDLLPLIDLNREELERLVEVDGEATEAVKTRLAVLDQQAKDLARGKGNEEAYAEALRGTKTAVEGTTGALQDYAEQLRAMADPVFAAIRAADDAAEAQDEYNAAVKEFGPESAEAVAAAEDLVGANIDLAEAQGELIAKGPGFRGEFRKMAESMNLPRDQIDYIIARLEILETIKIGDKTFNVNAKGNVGMGSGGAGFPDKKAMGGPVTAGMPYIVGENGPEGFVPSTNGTIVPNHGLGGNIEVHIHAGTVVGANGMSQLAATIRDELVKLGRRNGSTGIF